MSAAISLSAAHHEESSAEGAHWEIDAAHTQIDFKVRHMMVSYVRGTFGEFSGSFSGLVEGTPKGSVTIQAASIDTGNEKRDGHLRGADFFNVEEFPEITFTISELHKMSGGDVHIVGDLSMHGVTKKVTFVGEMNGPIQNPWGQTVIGVSVSTEIDRTEFGLNWNKAIEAGGVVVGDTVKITANFEVVKK
jgi:polyisoprenoid-binding protein YceI